MKDGQETRFQDGWKKIWMVELAGKAD